jgi:hypothetical protein
MLKTRRHTPQFDALEGKVLLSTGMANPAAALHRQAAKRVVLNGTLHGLPSGSTGPQGYSVTSFQVGGNAGSMGNVGGAFELADSLIPIGRLPDLSNASLILANQKGSVVLMISASEKNHYRFKVLGGTGSDARTFGSGSVKISSNHDSFDFVIKLHSTG